MRNYHFSIPFTLTPTLDTFRIGDTIYLQSYIPEILVDQLTGEGILVADYDFNIKSTINRMDTTGTPDAENHFLIINNKGSFDINNLSSVTLVDIHYEQDGTHQELLVSLIPQKRGLYQIVFYNLTADVTKVNLTNSDCFENLAISYAMNGNADDNNYYLLKSSPGPIATEESFKHDGGFVFEVIE